jgi:polysaccharide biosynthesis transport protein
MLQRNISGHSELAGARLLEHTDRRRRSSGEAEAFSSVLRSIRRNARLVAATTIIGTTIGVGVVLTITPKYKASVELLVDPRQTQVLKDRELFGAPGTGTESSVIESEAEMLRSPALMRRVAEDLNLSQDDEFGSPGLIGRVKALVLWPLRKLLGRGADGDALAAVVPALQTAVDAKRRNLTYVIELTVWSKDAVKAARLANRIGELYLAEQIAAKRHTARQATQRLTQRANELRHRVTASENAYEKYKAESGLFDPGGENLSDRQIEKLNEQMVQARAETAQAKAKYEQLKQITPERLQSAAASPDVLQSSVVSNLRGQYAEAAKHAAELTTRYGPQHPQVQIVRAQLANLSGQITGEIERIVTSAKGEYGTAMSRQASLEASLNELKESGAKFNQSAIRLRELEREAQANRDLFQALLSRAKELSAQLEMQLPDSRIVSAASVPTKPSYPSRVSSIGLAFFGSLGLGIAGALARTAFAKGVRNSDDIKSLVGLHPLASIPLVGEQRPRTTIGTGLLALRDMRVVRKASDTDPGDGHTFVADERPLRLGNMVLDRPDSSFAENLRGLCLSLKHAAREADTRVVLVTSALPGEGKSTVSVNLARSAAAAGDRVLLIDGDLRRPSIADALDMRESSGLVDVLVGRTNLRSSVRRDPRTGLYVIAGQSGVSGSTALSLLSSSAMAQLISMARQAFDHVIVDTSPLLPIADARRLLEYADGVILVVALEDTPREAIVAALRHAPALEDRLLGIVLNKSVDEFARYYADPAATPYREEARA